MKRFVLVAAVLLSTLLAAYGPMAIYSYAETASEAKLSEFKQKALREIDRRVASYQKSIDNLKVDVSVSTEDTAATKDTLASAFSYSQGVIGGKVAIPSDLQDKVRQFAQKMIDQLLVLRGKVADAKSLQDVQKLTKNIDAQYKLNQLAQVQTAVTQSVESMTGVLENMKETFNNLRGQLAQAEDCVEGVVPAGADVNCSDYKPSNTDTVGEIQTQLDSASSIITTISSIIMSCVTLLGSLVSQFSSLASGLGGKDSLGNIGDLSNMVDPAQLSSLTGGTGGASGIIQSLSGLASQLDIASFLSSSSLSSLTNISDLINA